MHGGALLLQIGNVFSYTSKWAERDNTGNTVWSNI